MDRWSGKVAIVTGASIGIGTEITEALVKNGVKVVGVARRVERIRDLAAKLKGQKGSLYPMACDMSKEEDILKVFQWTEKELGGVDVLINNAGVLVSETIINGSTENYRKIMDVNVIAVAICAREAVCSMKKRNVSGHIINVASIGGHNAEIVTVPLSLYCASKYAVIGMSHSLRNELTAAKMSIKVTCISPGAVKTDMIVEAGIPQELLERMPILTGKDIAEAVIYALSTPPNVQVKDLIITPLAPLNKTLQGEGTDSHAPINDDLENDHIVDRRRQSKMDRWSGKVAIVTGASSGIGADITEALVKNGVKVVGLARRVQRVRDIATKLKGQKGTLYPMECDLSREDDILKVFQWTEKEVGGVDILINNAAVVFSEPIIDGSTENYRKIMDVNVTAVAICAREAIRSMKKHNISGHIINIASILGHNAEIFAYPISLYCASKYALVGMSHSLRNELSAAKMNIKVTCISPGAVKTDMIVTAGLPRDMLEKVPILTGKDIAEAVIFALSTPRNVQVKELIITPLAPLDDVFH
ncbi:uncharacterized short-chain type dehydrogenase/reductase y4vI-like [Venturia canescens]|uniref:uncharacterized short-chain type dehydrogenase/reductase y4vI-like n=1 Tax=Venturia canescens TaxID=32260 RepID=UPI001C9CF982|nr:uncharacterized short-chain type dehydrogenase/reductase y4vI-like [Venturia canescens]